MSNNRSNKPHAEQEKRALWEELNRAASARRELSYFDPDTGLQVITSYAQLKRGTCCGSGCRHCPYDHAAVPKKRGSSQR